MFPWKNKSLPFPLSMIVVINLSRIVEFLINLPTNYANFPSQTPVIRDSIGTSPHLKKSVIFFPTIISMLCSKKSEYELAFQLKAMGNFYLKKRWVFIAFLLLVVFFPVCLSSFTTFALTFICILHSTHHEGLYFYWLLCELFSPYSTSFPFSILPT